MSEIVNVGNNNARLMSSAPNFDPELGWSSTQTWEGSEEALKAVMGQFAARGFRCRAYPYNGPVWRAEFTVSPDPGESGLPEVTDQWDFDTEFAQELIWNNPRVRALAVGSTTLSLWKKEIKKAIDDGLTDEKFLEKGPSDEEFSLFKTVNLGGEAWEFRRITLRRRRTLPLNSAQGTRLNAVERIYSTPALIDLVGIPSSIAQRLPPTPVDVPDFFAWSWKLRRDSSEFIPQLNKASETKEWVFAPWSEVAYILIV